ncbi:hypothetical protein [Flavobacterium sp. NKUCC04_CG]|uniref:hypothetical protein n=1 Tax=Flavobacterium sp. NKUCC04_CG TaxID=2842121 RepID=UPI001C5A616D|nr:hypothetical protein [Flavobacterium sp. NKUCC04_CG]MBW3519098.1 hypothetical protein [Flavobacterium sp. NKUCC04_CG]
MKTIIYLFFSVFLFSSCDFIFKKDEKSEPVFPAKEKVVLGSDLDSNGCAISAGYRWSELRNDCIRVFEEGFRLNPINIEEGNPEENELEDNDVSGFVVFNSEKTKAEIFLPYQEKSILLNEKATTGIYGNENWELDTRKDWELKHRGVLKFTAAKAVDLKITGSDQIDDE